MRSLNLLVFFVVFCSVQTQFSPPHEFDCGSLCDYVRRDDGHYSYEYMDQKTYTNNGVTTYMFNMTSQRWMPDESWTDRPVWWHWLIIHVPDDLVFTDHALLWVGLGTNTGGDPSPTSKHNAQLNTWARRGGMVTALLMQIPNQPMNFNGSLLRDRTEDGIIAYTWKQYIDQPEDEKNPEVLLRWPMCKAVSKAMTTMQDVLKNDPKNTGHVHVGTDLQGFMVAGESKRGWTTWMMPAVDSRVKLMAPIVLSCLNVLEVFPKYYMSLNGWPVAMGDYWIADIMSYMDDPIGAELMDYVDPYAPRYRPSLDIPKYIISGAKDEFFMMDDYDYFYDDLPGEKYMWLQENTGHEVTRGPIEAQHWAALETFFVAFLRGKERPKFAFHRQITEKGGSILLHTDENVIVQGWSAITPDIVVPKRDFRSFGLYPLPQDPLPVYIAQEPTNLGNGWYELYYDNPPEGHYRAFFMKLVFPWQEESREFVFSTKAVYLPEGFPYEMCTGTGLTGCRGILT